MNETKLIQLLKSLSPWELKSFQQYVVSPFFNVNESVTKLLELLIHGHPEFEESEITFEKIFKKLFKNKKFNHQKLRYVMTDLTLLLEDFLAYSVFEEKTFYKKKFLLQKLKEKNHDKYFQQHLTIGYEQQENSSHRDLKFYKRQLGYDELSYEFTSLKDNRAIDTSLQSLSDNLDIYYLSNKLKYGCEILNRQNIVQVGYKIPFLDFIIDYLNKKSFDHVPVISVYFQILLTLKEHSNEKHYHKLKSLLNQQTGFSINELRDMYGFVQNYCIRKINTGNTKYLKELFEIYKLMLDKKIILENKELGHSHFKNIVAIALRQNEFEWTENFISTYSTYLNKELRKNSVNYNLARLYFAKNEFRKALKLLTTVEFTDVYYHLDSKSLLLKIYYEIEETEPLFSLISTFSVYLRRSKLISDYQRIIYSNLVKHVKRLEKIKSGSNYSLEKIKNSVAADSQIADIGWLKSKMEELEE
ncbi:MAG TPA: hypothetical protein VJY62_18480 [Bacteroidia bacterium]|nr:hypothetical protein [Bacteroidia bacterium]